MQSTIIFSRNLSREARKEEDDWAGLAEAKARRKIQNRLNQRSYRRRRTAEREARKASAEATALRWSKGPVPLAPRQAQAGSQAIEQAAPISIGIKGHDASYCSPVLGQDVVSLPSRLVGSLDADTTGRDNREDRAATTTLVKQEWSPKMIQNGLIRHLPEPSFATKPCAAILQNRDVRRIHHYALSTLWPNFGHHVLITDESLSSAFFRLSMTNELLLNSFIWTAALEMSLHSCSATDKAVMIHCQNNAVKSIREHIERGNVLDEVIFAVLALAIADTEPKPAELVHAEECFAGFDPPLRSLGWLDYFSQFRWTRTHIDALKALVEKRGGLSKVNTPGIADQVQATDIIQASLALMKPNFELCHLYHHVLEHQVKVIRPPRSRANQFDVSDHFKDLLLDMRLYCRLLNRSYDDVQTALLSWEMNVQRNLIQYRLLSLSRGQDEICRLAALIFSNGVIFPIARKHPLQMLVKQLVAELERRVDWDNKSSEFLLWVTVVGGLAATGSVREEFYLRALKRLATDLCVTGYDDLRGIMHDYLWLDRACDDGASKLWNRAMSAGQESPTTTGG